MNKFKKILNKIANPRPIFVVFYIVFALAVISSTIIVLVLGYSYTVWCYVLYGASAMILPYLVYLSIYYAPKTKDAIIVSMKKNKFMNELLESYGYRSVIFLFVSSLINIAYAISHAVIAILSHSIWYGALALYYASISLIRCGIIVVARRKKKRKENYTLENQVRSYRNCGIYLMLLNLALGGAVVQMVYSNQGFKYAGIMIYVMAIYTFYKLALSIYNLIKARKHYDYTTQSIKNISFADSLVSLLALQTALLQAFAGDYQPYLPNSLTGGIVSIVIITIGIIMIVRGNKKLNELQEKKHEQEI